MQCTPEIAFDRNGRFTLAVISLNGYAFWGTARLDTRDEDRPEVGRHVALEKALTMLVEWWKRLDRKGGGAT